MTAPLYEALYMHIIKKERGKPFSQEFAVLQKHQAHIKLIKGGVKKEDQSSVYFMLTIFFSLSL